MKSVSISKYNNLFKDNNIKLKYFPVTVTDNLFIKINGRLVKYKDVEKKYFDYYVEGLQLLPCGAVLYLKENN